ncbi:MAG: LEPR-XLL domain-containing protein, partial [Phycisphaeraceae bacterium]|nr:LEPR-XLL domain-containing protein [Phycisphaeraceae bacterium]
MGLLDWVRKSRGEGRLRKAASSPQAPCFEQLEPRVLLSADYLMPVESPLIETPCESAIVVDLEESGTDRAFSSQPSALSQSEEGMESEAAQEGSQIIDHGSQSSEDGETVGRSDGMTVGQSDSGTVDQLNTREVIPSNSQPVVPSQGLSLSELVTASQLITAQQNQNQTSIADASEDLPLNTENLEPKTDVNFTPLDTTLGSIEPRGPPVGTHDDSTVLNEVAYRPSDEKSESSATQGLASNQQLVTTNQQPNPERFNPLQAPELPGLIAVSAQPSALSGQVIYLDFDGAKDVTYDGPITVSGIDVPAFRTPEEFAGQEAEIIQMIVSQLEQIFAGSGVTFATVQPMVEQLYSTIYIGGDDSTFAECGEFLGLAEQVDVRNVNRRDDAFVFSEEIVSEELGAEGFISQLVDVIFHEIGHLLGYEHHQGNPDFGLLSSVANEAYSNAILAQGPVAYYPLNELNGGSEVLGSSGNDLHGIGQGDPTLGKTGVLDQSRGIQLECNPKSNPEQLEGAVHPSHVGMDEVPVDAVHNQPTFGSLQAVRAYFGELNSNTSHPGERVRLASVLQNPDQTTGDNQSGDTQQLIETPTAPHGPPNVTGSNISNAYLYNGTLIVLAETWQNQLVLQGVTGSDYLELRDGSQNHVFVRWSVSDCDRILVVGTDDADDTLTVDLRSTSSLSYNVEFWGGEGGFDSLILIGNPAFIANYSAIGADAGTIELASTNALIGISFAGLEPVTVHDLVSYTFTTSGSADIILIDSPAPGQNRITGTSDGVPFESVTFYNVSDLTIDTGANDLLGNSSDSITIDSTGLVASGLESVTISTGSGVDVVIVVPAADASIVVEGGDGYDRLIIDAQGQNVIFSSDSVLISGMLPVSYTAETELVSKKSWEDSGGFTVLLDNLDTIADEIIGLLDNLDTIADEIIGLNDNALDGGILNRRISGLDSTINDLAGMEALLSIGEHIKSYLTLFGATGSLSSLLNHLETEWASSFGMPQDAKTLAFHVTENELTVAFDAELTISEEIRINLGPEAEEIGLTLSDEATIPVEGTIDVAFHLDINLQTDESVFILDEFLIDVSDKPIDVSDEPRDILLNAHLGPVEVAIGQSGNEGHIVFNVCGSISIIDNDVSFTPQGDSTSANKLDLYLPVYISIAEQDVDMIDSNPSIVLEEGFLFDALSFDAFDQLVDLKSFDSEAAFSVFPEMEAWLEALSDAGGFNADVPFLRNEVLIMSGEDGDGNGEIAAGSNIFHSTSTVGVFTQDMVDKFVTIDTRGTYRILAVEDEFTLQIDHYADFAFSGHSFSVVDRVPITLSEMFNVAEEFQTSVASKVSYLRDGAI